MKTFLDWLTTFHFAKFVYTQCKHRFGSYLFTLHEDATKLSLCELFFPLQKQIPPPPPKKKKPVGFFASFLHNR